MSLSDIPRSVRMESQLADESTLFTPGQKRAVITAIKYCVMVGLNIADYERLYDRIDEGLVLSKKDRRQLRDVLNRHNEERLEPNERMLNAWARRDLRDAHRPPAEGGHQ